MGMIKTSKKYIMYTYIIVVIMGIMVYNLISKIDKVEQINAGVIITFIIIGIISVFNIIIDTMPFSLNKVFCFFNFFFLFLAPLLQYIGGYYPWNYHISSNILLKCNILIILWLILYMFVNILVKSKNETTIYKSAKINISKNEILKSLIYSFGAFIILTLLIGFKNLFFRESNTIDIGSDLINSIIQKFLRSVPIFSLAIYVILHQRGILKKSKLNFVILFVLVIILNFPASMSRYWIGAAYLGLLLICFKEKIRNRTFDIIIIFVLAVIFPIFTLFKNNDLMTVLNKRLFLDLGNVYFNVDFDAYSMFARIVMYVEEFGLEMGKQLSCSLLFFIPRALWTTKPYPTGVMVATRQGAFYTNLSSPLISEAYIDFGIIGIIFFAIVSSYIIAYLDNKYWKREENNNITFIEITYPFMLGFMLFLQRGSMQPVVTHAFSFYLYIILKWVLSKVIIKKEKKNEMFDNQNSFYKG